MGLSAGASEADGAADAADFNPLFARASGAPALRSSAGGGSMNFTCPKCFSPLSARRLESLVAVAARLSASLKDQARLTGEEGCCSYRTSNALPHDCLPRLPTHVLCLTPPPTPLTHPPTHTHTHTTRSRARRPGAGPLNSQQQCVETRRRHEVAKPLECAGGCKTLLPPNQSVFVCESHHSFSFFCRWRGGTAAPRRRSPSIEKRERVQLGVPQPRLSSWRRSAARVVAAERQQRGALPHGECVGLSELSAFARAPLLQKPSLAGKRLAFR